MDSNLTGLEILAHRGQWSSHEDQNSLSALTRALESGFGVETDIRASDDDLIIQHDAFPNKTKLKLKDFFDKYNTIKSKGTLALNIKSDGIYGELQKLLKLYYINNYFVFDMSIPELIQYKKLQLNVFYRKSMIEDCCAVESKFHSVWLDMNLNDKKFQHTLDSLYKLMNLHEKTIIVSPELHGLSTRQELFSIVKKVSDKGRLGVCTDHPEELNRLICEQN